VSLQFPIFLQVEKYLVVPNAWGFGIAYPSQAPDGIHFDVGVASFIEHISNNINI
jgi:hypothetical protein